MSCHYLLLIVIAYSETFRTLLASLKIYLVIVSDHVFTDNNLHVVQKTD